MLEHWKDGRREEIHGQEAKDYGSEELPPPVKGMMTATSKIMTTLSRYF